MQVCPHILKLAIKREFCILVYICIHWAEELTGVPSLAVSEGNGPVRDPSLCHCSDLRGRQHAALGSLPLLALETAEPTSLGCLTLYRSVPSESPQGRIRLGPSIYHMARSVKRS